MQLSRANSYRIIDLKIVEAGFHHEQYTRPYDVNFSAGTIETLRERMENEGGRLSSTAIGSTFGTSDGVFVSAAPDVNADGEGMVADIPYGWEERRYRFVLIFETTTPNGPELEVVQGFTSHWEDPTIQSSRLPDDTEFVINAISKMRQTRTKTGRGYTDGWKAGSSDHILSSSSGGIGRGRNGLLDNTLFTLRPTEIIGIAASSAYRDELNDSGGVNAVGIMNNLPTLASRSNNTATAYASKFFSAVGRSYATDLIGGSQEAEDTGGFGIDSRIATARTYLHESSYTDYNFCTALSRIHTVKTKTFTLGDLFRIDPNAPDSIGTASLLDDSAFTSTRFNEYTSEWYGQDISTQVAAILGSSVPVIMSRYGIMKCSFTMTNQTIDGTHNFAFTTKPGSIMGTVTVSDKLINNFQDTLIDECVRQISENNARDYNMTCSFSLIGDSVIKISMDGGDEYTYAIPSYTDGLLSPQITSDQEYRYEFSDHMVGVSTLLSDPDCAGDGFSEEVENFTNKERSTLRTRSRERTSADRDGYVGFGSGRNDRRDSRRTSDSIFRDDDGDNSVGFGLSSGRGRFGSR